MDAMQQPWADAASVPVEQIPALLGAVEAYRAHLWQRMTAPPRLDLVSNAQSSPPLLTAAQAAERLGVTTARVYQLIRTGELPSVPIGKYKRIAPVALDAWVSARQQAAK
jgi:excisionase family DNA binding protein